MLFFREWIKHRKNDEYIAYDVTSISTYSKNITETGISRLKALHQSNDGFFIAEEDLKLRGPGEVFGTAQSGYFALNIADLSRDKEILKTARYDALCQLKQRNP